MRALLASMLILVTPLAAQGPHVDAAPALEGAEPAPQEPETPDGGLPVPEPSTLLLVGTGLVGFALTARLRRRRQ